MRHLNTQALWIRDAASEMRVQLRKVAGTENPADLMAKHLDARTLNKMLTKLGMAKVAGRSALPPKLAQDASTELPLQALERLGSLCHVDLKCVEAVSPGRCSNSLGACCDFDVDMPCRASNVDIEEFYIEGFHTTEGSRLPTPVGCQHPPGALCCEDTRGLGH